MKIDRLGFKMAAAPVEVSLSRSSNRARLQLLPPAAASDIERWLDAPPDRPYDPEAIADRYRGQYWQIGRRIAAVILPFLWLWLQSNLDRLLGREQRRRPHYAIRLREILTELGPAYIKIGQALSTRPDLVSPVFLEELTKLQDQLPPFPNAIAYQLIEEQLGAKPDEIFANLSPYPIAAASLGQVYKGYLRSNGAAVAIKVQRPDLVDRISIDLYIVRILARWARDNVPASQKRPGGNRR